MWCTHVRRRCSRGTTADVEVAKFCGFAGSNLAVRLCVPAANVLIDTSAPVAVNGADPIWFAPVEELHRARARSQRTAVGRPERRQRATPHSGTPDHSLGLPSDAVVVETAAPWLLW